MHIRLLTLVVVGFVLAGCGEDETSAPTPDRSKSNPKVIGTPAAKAKSETPQDVVAEAAMKELRASFGPGPLKAPWWKHIKDVSSQGGRITVRTTLGADADADGPATAICGLIGPLTTDDDRIKGTTITGIDANRQEVDVKECPGS